MAALPPPRNNQTEHPHARCDTETSPTFVGALYDALPGFDPAAGVWPQAQLGGRDAPGWEAVMFAFKDISKRLLDSRNEQLVPWCESVLPAAVQTDARNRLVGAMRKQISLVQAFIQEAGAGQPSSLQQRLSYIQTPHVDMVAWLGDVAYRVAGIAQFGDIALGALMNAAVSLIPPYTEGGVVPPAPRGGSPGESQAPPPLEGSAVERAVEHYHRWYKRILDIATNVRDLVRFMQSTRPAGVTALLSTDASVTYGLNRFISKIGNAGEGALAQMSGANAAVLVQKYQSVRIRALWYEERDAEFRLGLDGGAFTTYTNVGSGDCFYASLAMAIGQDGLTPDPRLALRDRGALHTFIRKMVAEQHFGPPENKYRNITNPHYRATLQAMEIVRLAGELNQYAAHRRSYRPIDLNHPENGWLWDHVPLSEGPEQGETLPRYEARQGPNQERDDPRRVAEADNAFRHRVTKAFKAWIGDTMINSGPGVPGYWAQTVDIAAAATKFSVAISFFVFGRTLYVELTSWRMRMYAMRCRATYLLQEPALPTASSRLTTLVWPPSWAASSTLRPLSARRAMSAPWRAR